MSAHAQRWFVLGAFLATGHLAAQTQGEVNQQYKKADQSLKATYAKVLKDYVRDRQFRGKLRQAQRAWVAFRDAHLAARFPRAEKQAEYGSSYPARRCAVLTELTEQRTKELKTWADGIPEGDVCNGSVKTTSVEGVPPTMQLSQAARRCAKGPGL